MDDIIRGRTLWSFRQVFLLGLLLEWFSRVGVHAREADERSHYLYLHNAAAREVVWEYEHHMHAPHFVIEDRSEKHSNFAAEIAQTNMTERDLRPFFLRSDYPIPRVVEYYSPWCGACQAYGPKYISVATDILSKLPPFHLEFYAVSCSEHHLLCQDEKIKHYPTTRAYKAYTDEYRDVLSLSSNHIIEDLELQIQLQAAESVGSEGDDFVNDAADESNDVRTLDILGATKDSYRHTRTDVYRDAALSFTFALENHIFQEGQTALTPEQASAFTEWLDMLYWTLPPTWMLHALINDLRRDIDKVVASKDLMMSIVKSQEHVVHDKDMHWSQGCRNGEGVVASFSCGMWCLFHIVAVGVPERHKSVLGYRHRVSTKHAADTLINYIQHFFDWCPQCREQTLQLHHSCAFNSCRRFRQRNKKSQKHPPESTWKEFPIWLWEVHNEINQMLMAKHALKLQGRKPTKTELELARWPPKDACYLCYRDNGSWMSHQVYEYLKEEYWPAGVQNTRFVVLDKQDEVHIQEAHWLYGMVEEVVYDLVYFFTPKQQYEMMGGLMCIVAILTCFLISTIARTRLRMRKIRRTGRHKKYDAGVLFDDA